LYLINKLGEIAAESRAIASLFRVEARFECQEIPLVEARRRIEQPPETGQKQACTGE